MNVREALEKKWAWFAPLPVWQRDDAANDIEIALQAAYTRGADDGYDPSLTKKSPMNPDNGVTAGIATLAPDGTTIGHDKTGG